MGTWITSVIQVPNRSFILIKCSIRNFFLKDCAINTPSFCRCVAHFQRLLDAGKFFLSEKFSGMDEEEVFDVRAEVAQRWGRVAGFPRCIFLNGLVSVDPVCGFFDGVEESGVPGGSWGAGSGCGREKDEGDAHQSPQGRKINPRILDGSICN
jgi:hypothetical protein